MSIIYDALKKVENAKITDNPLPQNNVAVQIKSHSKVKHILIYILVVCLGLFLSNLVFNYMHASKQVKARTVELKGINTPAPKNVTPVTEPLASNNVPVTEIQKPIAPTFVLNGVFFEGENGYALINNIIVRVGDEVSKARVKLITLDEVQLDYEGTIIKLSNRQS